MSNVFVFLLPVLGITTALLSVVVQIILKSHGFKINFFYPEYFYEYKILKKIYDEKGKYLYLMLSYRILSILFLIDIILAVLSFF